MRLSAFFHKERLKFDTLVASKGRKCKLLDDSIRGALALMARAFFLTEVLHRTCRRGHADGCIAVIFALLLHTGGQGKCSPKLELALLYFFQTFRRYAF